MHMAKLPIVESSLRLSSPTITKPMHSHIRSFNRYLQIVFIA